MMLIDPPVTPYDPEPDLQAWLDLLRTEYPQDDESVAAAIAEVAGWLAAKAAAAP